jgi:hypothetical protein
VSADFRLDRTLGEIVRRKAATQVARSKAPRSVVGIEELPVLPTGEGRQESAAGTVRGAQEVTT